MATNFPTSLDTLTNPTSSDSLSSPSHSAQHANVNDAVEALQAKVGADSSAVTSSLDYKVAQLESLGASVSFTPSWTNVTVGNGTQNAFYVEVNELLHVVLDLTLGSTSAVTGNITLDNPTGAVMQDIRGPVGQVWMVDVTGTNVAGHIRPTGTSQLRLYAWETSGSYISESSVNATTPFTWATGDQLRLSYTVATS
jgi:hypothetical protein